MAKTFFEQVKSFILTPHKAFDEEKKASLKDAILYGFKGFLIFALLYGIIFGAIALAFGTPLLPVLAFAMVIPFVGIAGQLLSSLWMHLWAYVFGAREGWQNTTKALFFGSTPNYIIGWIPLVNMVAGIWSLILFGMGLKKYQKLSTGKTVAAILIAIFIPMAIAIVIFSWVVMTYGADLLAMGSESTSAFSLPY